MAEIESQLLDYVNRPAYSPLKAKELAKKLGLRKKELKQFDELLDSLVSQGRLRVSDKGRVQPAAPRNTIVGVLKKTASGDGYVIPKTLSPDAGLGDVFVDRRDLKDAQQGDEVLVRLTGTRRSRGGRCGVLVDILERAATVFVGRYFEEHDAGWVIIDGRNFEDPVWVGDPGAKGAGEGDMVVVEMLRFPSHAQYGEAVLTKVLGPRGEPGVDTQTILHEFGIPQEFSEEALDQARRAVEVFREDRPEGREDWTAETTVTIDPVDARDFDDAISLRRSADGHWHLAVHIADVSHFVPAHTALDAEAEMRGNSVYLPTLVVPMLPEVISNGLASLQSGRIRFTKTVLIEFDAEGMPVHSRVANTMIRVDQRFAYEEVLPLILADHGVSPAASQISAEVLELLRDMYELSRLLRERRLRRGALELSLPEIKLELDREGRVTGAQDRLHDESHQVIEEFMLAANMAVARLLSECGVHFLRRIHGSPSLIKLQQFQEFVESLGLPLKNPQSRRELQKLLNLVRGTPLEQAIHYACLRSMKQAVYSPQAEGHYALGEEDYCHFTSPIRRYPDLVVHRILDEVLLQGASTSPYSLEQLTRLGIHCSMTERRAESAERELIHLKLLQFLHERIGLEFPAIITGIERFGLFCKGTELPVDGLVHISSLPYDRYDYDAQRLALVGRRADNFYQLGQALVVGVAQVDVDRRTVDLRFVRKLESPPARQPGKSSRFQPGSGGKATSRKKDRQEKQPAARRKKATRGDKPNTEGDVLPLKAELHDRKRSRKQRAGQGKRKRRGT